MEDKVDTEPKSYKEYMKKHIEDLKRTGDVVVNGMIEHNLENPNSNTAMLMALVGMQTELGEISDLIQKKVFYGIDIDRASLIEEMGDFLFYWDLLQDQLRSELCCSSINDITIRDLNRKKRKVRYPNGYSKEASQHRNLEEERKVFDNLD